MVDHDADPEATAAVRLRPGTDADAEAAAALHVTGIDEGFLARLGPVFLGRLYRRVARSPDSFLLVAEADGHVVGFLAGSLDVSALYRRFLRRDGLAAATGSIGPLLRAWPSALETLRHGRRDRSEPGVDAHAVADRGDAELLAMAVDRAWQGGGVGRRLVEGFLTEVVRRGAASADVVVGADNERARWVYGRAGFVPAAAFELHRGRPSLRLHWTPSAAPGDDGPGSAP
jgi:ribosomal protein S18 acetylase RimI-like enzyme